MAKKDHPNPDHTNRWSHLMPTWRVFSLYSTSVLLFTGFAFIFVMLPTPFYIKDELMHTDKFIAERAQLQLQTFVNIGQKVAGSVENEVLAIEFIVKEVEKIIAEQNPIHKIEIDVQKASGGFFLDFQPWGLTSIYEGLQNVVIKFGPADHEPEHSIMVNTHFDTVPVSPGAGDAGIMVVAILEMLRVLSKSPDTLQHSLVFLINGAEENSLQGAHAFIAQHKWAPNVRAFVNLDSSGTGGKEVMFQAGPGHPWLMKYYRKSAPHPMCTTLGEELFQANLIPSDTDFRIFRDFGNIPGMDFALSENGYIYHTKYDRFELIPLGTYQHVGDNILPLLKELGNAPEIVNTEQHSEGKVVFYDVLGRYMIYYTATQAIYLNVIVALAFFVVVGLSLMTMSKYSKMETLKELGFAFIVQLVSTGLGVAIVLALALIYDSVFRPMSWYTNPMLIFGLYFCPMFFGFAIGPVLFLKYRKKTIFTINHHVQLFLNAQCLIYVLVLLGLTALGIRSAFVVMVPVLFYTIVVFINWITNLQNRGHIWVYVLCVGQIVPLMFFSELTTFSIRTFVPTLGRGGPISNPEMMIAAFTILYGLFMGGFLVPLVNLAKRPFLLSLIFLGLALIGAVLAFNTTIGFPYREATSPQRFWVFHTDRKFHNIDKSVRLEDSGYFILDMDRNSPHYVHDHVTNITDARILTEECETELYCGMPIYRTRGTHDQAAQSHYLLAPKPYLNQIPELGHTGFDVLSSTVRRYNFKMTGPDHMGLFISPVINAKIINWSFLDSVSRSGPKWQNRDTYFVYYFSADNTFEYEFHLDIEIDGQWPDHVLDITHTGHFMHYDEERTRDFMDFIESFPPWAHVTSWMTSVESWKF